MTSGQINCETTTAVRLCPLDFRVLKFMKNSANGDDGKGRDGPPRRVTAFDVAQLAKVSRSAVSRAYTPGASIAPEKRDRILAVADNLEIGRAHV